MNEKREVELAEFKNKHENFVTITADEVEGGKTVEIFNKGTYFFQIRWKLYVSQKHIGVKNVCRIACTEDGNIKIDDCIRIEFPQHFIINKHLMLMQATNS